MALTLEAAATTAVATTAPKSITIQSQGSGSATMYTVPTGRTFTGYLWCNNNTFVGRVNDVDLRNPTSGIARLEVRLTAGDVVKASPTASDYTFIQGLESDA
jgi:phosphate-selective porin